jgi:transcriptional/translational regulatory protein YebC/TACO1
VRNAFKDAGGHVGAAGSASFHFRKMGVFRLPAQGIDADALELELIDHGLEEMNEGASEKGEPQWIVRCGFGDLGRLQRALEAKGIHPVSSGTEYVPVTTLDLPEEKAKEVLALVDALEQDDDVQRVFHTLP